MPKRRRNNEKNESEETREPNSRAASSIDHKGVCGAPQTERRREALCYGCVDKVARLTLALADLEAVCRMMNNRPTLKTEFIVW